MSNSLNTVGNPFVGPRAFTRDESQRFFGREVVARELRNVLISERLVLLHAQSGAGKSSLIEAGLVSLFKPEQFRVLPTVRVNKSIANDTSLGANRYVRSTILSLAVDSDAAPAESDIGELSLARYLDGVDATNHSANSANGPAPVLLIFDQFEEILTTDENDHAGRLTFFAQLGEALRLRHRWALFAMRRESVAGLDPYLNVIPGGISRRFPLSLLRPEEAANCIQKTAALGVPSRTFLPGALDELLLNLRKIKQENNKAPRIDEFVEPVYLQVVCRTMWSGLPQDVTTIDLPQIKTLGDVDNALAKFYADAVRVASGENSKLEDNIRLWISKELIVRGKRPQVVKGTEQDYGISAEMSKRLVSTFLIREDTGRSSWWYELAHDRLIEPVLRDNERVERVIRMRRVKLYGSLGAAMFVIGVSVLAFLAFEARQRAEEVRKRAIAYAESSKREAQQSQRDANDAESIVHSLAVDRADTTVLKELLKQSRGAAPSIALQVRKADPSADTVSYFRKQTDPPTLLDSLNRLGFHVNVKGAIVGTLLTNSVAYGSATNIENVKLISLAMLRAGLVLRTICPPTQGTGGPHTIQLFGSGRDAKNPAITVEQVNNLSTTNRTINCTAITTR